MSIIIKNWGKHFETNETRKLKKLLWVKLPNQQDSLEFRLISKMDDGGAILGAWLMLVQIASKQEIRGTIPFSPDELGIITGFPADLFSRAIFVLKSPKIAWIVEIPDTSGDSPDTSGNAPENLPIEEGRKEGRKEGKVRPVAAPKIVAQIVDHLNLICGTSYRPNSKGTVSFIKSRLSEGFSLEDFKAVIEKKSEDWSKDEKMNAYLRPQTLFGTKFENYLQTAKKAKPALKNLGAPLPEIEKPGGNK